MGEQQTSDCHFAATNKRTLALSIFLSQAIVMFWSNHTSIPTILEFRKDPRSPWMTAKDPRFCGQLLLLIDYTVEFPLIYAFHPMVYRPQHLLVSPDLWNLCLQISIFLAIDCVTRLVLETDSWIFSNESGEYGSSVANDFIVTRTTLMAAIGIIQGPLLLGFKEPPGDFHFMALLSWLVIRHARASTGLINSKFVFG